MPDLDLARRPGVELVKTGSWATMTGSWNPTPEDLAAAVEAQACPAIRKPIVKLGHVDSRFDGEPALGWFENLRVADGGTTLVGDQVTLPWLHAVQAAAYPSRSIEGNYNHTCSEGHKHKFVLTAVALLGVTPPAVKTIRNLNDLPAALGVAAGEEVPEGAEPVQVTIRAADAETVHTGAMVALIPTAEDAARLAVDGGEPADELHVTLAYLGTAADLGAMDRQAVIGDVTSGVRGLWQVTADAFALSVFNPGDTTDRETCIVLGLSGTELDVVHDVILQSMWSSPMPEQHRPWTAHLTLAYTDDLARLPQWVDRIGPVTFDRVRIALGADIIDIPLGDPDDLGDAPTPTEIAAASGDDDQLKRYWLYGEGLKKWADSPHPWTALYRQILKHVKNVEKAKRIASDWYREHFGHMPNEKGVKAADPPQDPEPLPDSNPPAVPAPALPAAEPEQENTPDPIEEDFVSTELSAIRSRLGLPDDADEQTILSAVDALQAKADTPADPTPEMVAASAAAEQEKDELRKEVTVLASQLQQVTAEVAAAKAEKVATVKASVIQAAADAGKFTPAEREQWEKDYDEAPAAITRILASIAPGFKVPVAASGTAGDPEPALNLNLDDDALTEAFFGPGAAARFKTQEA